MTNQSELAALLKEAYQNLHASLKTQHAATLVALRDEFLKIRAAALPEKPVRGTWDAWPSRGNMGRYEYRTNETKRHNLDPLLVKDTPEGQYSSHPTYLVQADFDARVEAKAEAFATKMLEGYVAKLTGKLTGIWGTKEIAEMKFVGNISYHHLYFRFTDKSSFAVQNSVVHHINSHGTFYAQFPTTFHAVILSNGMAMKQASEAKMKKLFAESK